MLHMFAGEIDEIGRACSKLFAQANVQRDGVLAKLTKRVCATSAAKSTEADGEAADAPKELTEEPTVDFLKDRFYIPEELKYKAEVRYDKKGTDLAGLIVSVVLLVALGFVVQWLLPELLAFLDRAISAMR